MRKLRRRSMRKTRPPHSTITTIATAQSTSKLKDSF